MAAAVPEKAAAEVSPSPPPAQFTDHSPSHPNSNSRRSDASSDVADTPDCAFLDRSPSLSSSSAGFADSPSLLSLRSEEYRQLFRLPTDEVLVQDFNCALQENFLLQGHMYLFAHNICFYSNLFGFETKKIIPFHEITSVRRAKAAGIFPTAIEILAGGKKFFFTSFLSRDEAFKLINDGWVQHSNRAKATGDQQEPYSEPTSQESGRLLADKTESSDQLVGEAVSMERDKEFSLSDDTKPLDNGDYEIVPSPPRPPDILEEGTEIVQNTDCSSSGKSLILEEVDCDAPEVPESYTMVAESKFPVKVEKFFELFFSDDGVNFQESFHIKCGDKDFKCATWCPHEKFGHTRNVSFQHPIKIYFGARFGSCQELQKYQVYRNCHLVVETSQEISDVPYGDYFQVEGLWDVKTDGSEGCILKVYTNVAFSKKTMWKGKIVQSTIEECRDAYGIWIELAHEFLKHRKLEKEQAGGDLAANLIPNGQIDTKKQLRVDECEGKSNGASDVVVSQTLPDSNSMNRHAVDSLQERATNAASVSSLFRDLSSRFSSLIKSQSQFYVFLIVAIAVVLLLMQMSILVLLSRPQQIHVIPQGDCMGSMHGIGERGTETLGIVDKQINHLKEEMLIVEMMLDKMQNEYASLKVKLKDFERIRKYHK